jgi:hypothetical protein
MSVFVPFPLIFFSVSDCERLVFSYHLAVWTLEDLISSVGSIDRGAAIKALSTWVDHGVLKEDPENTFILLEKAEEGDPDVGREARVLGSYFLSGVLFMTLRHHFPSM